MSNFEEGTRVRITEQYAINIGLGADPSSIEETGATGTVTGVDPTYIRVTIDPVGDLEGHFLFFPEELELV